VRNVHSCLADLGLPIAMSNTPTAWEIRQVLDCPQQNNSFDCGVFVMKFMELWNGSTLNAECRQEDMRFYRQKIVVDIILAKENLVRHYCPADDDFDEADMKAYVDDKVET
ncbi:hypothetical protein FRX31_006583, partial [Thalictrum thalictroides]